MNRKQVLKNVKNKKKGKNVVEEENYFNRFVMTIGILLIVLIVGYFLIGIFVNKTITFKKKTEKEETNEVIIDNSTILAGELFEQKEDNYYVIVTDFSDDKNILPSWISLYSSKDEALKVYKIDSSNKMNSKFIVEKDSNTSPDSYENLKIVSPTLIRIENKNVAEYIEGEEAIKEALK